MNKQITVTAAFLGMLAVIAGAFGAHGLKAVLSVPQLGVWQTAVQYHFYHVFALLFLASFSKARTGLISAGYYLFTMGIVFFSGSLYLLSCREVLGLTWLSPKVLGPITPLGGLLFIAGWITLGLAAYRNK